MWVFDGTGADLIVRLSDTGKWSLGGYGTQECRPGQGDFAVVGLAREAKAEWNLYSADDDDVAIDSVRTNRLREFFQQNEGKTVAAISYSAPGIYNGIGKQPALIGADILMPPTLAHETMSFLRGILGNGSIRYRLILEFFGLMPAHVREYKIPNVKEFADPDILSRRAYLSDDSR